MVSILYNVYFHNAKQEKVTQYEDSNDASKIHIIGKARKKLKWKKYIRKESPYFKREASSSNWWYELFYQWNSIFQSIDRTLKLQVIDRLRFSILTFLKMSFHAETLLQVIVEEASPQLPHCLLSSEIVKILQISFTFNPFLWELCFKILLLQYCKLF